MDALSTLDTRHIFTGVVLLSTFCFVMCCFVASVSILVLMCFVVPLLSKLKRKKSNLFVIIKL